MGSHARNASSPLLLDESVFHELFTQNPLICLSEYYSFAFLLKCVLTENLITRVSLYSLLSQCNMFPCVFAEIWASSFKSVLSCHACVCLDENPLHWFSHRKRAKHPVGRLHCAIFKETLKDTHSMAIGAVSYDWSHLITREVDAANSTDCL